MMTMAAPTAADKLKDQYIKELHAMVPQSASLGIGESEMTHVSHLHHQGHPRHMDTDYILYSPGSGGDRALDSGEFEKVAERPGRPAPAQAQGPERAAADQPPGQVVAAGVAPAGPRRACPRPGAGGRGPGAAPGAAPALMPGVAFPPSRGAPLVQHPRNQVGCGRGVAAGCSSTRNGPPARCHPTRAIQVCGRAVAGATPVASGA